MARSPTAGAARIKTRLASSVPTESDRLALYTAFLADTVLACRTVVGAVLRVAYTPEGGRDGFTALGISDDELLPQRGANLGERERYLFEDLFAAGFRRVVIIGSDLPTLPMRHVSDAIARLGEPGSNVVLGPSEDGGYSLIALSAAVAGRPRAGPLHQYSMEHRVCVGRHRAGRTHCGLTSGARVWLVRRRR